MSGNIPRPATSIASWQDLKAGDEIWEVYGDWPPRVGGRRIVHSAPAPFREHREYSATHSALADLVVFDLLSPDDARITARLGSVQFAADRNLDGPGYNNNYVFRSEADAEAYVAEAKAWWGARPNAVAREGRWRRDFDREVAAALPGGTVTQ